MAIPYRGASKQTLVWLVICLGGVAGMIATFILFMMWDGWAFLAGLSIWIASLWIGFRVTEGLKKARHQRIGEKLLPLGYEWIAGPSDQLKEEFFMPFAPLAGWMSLPLGAAGLQWIAMLPEGDEAMRLFEYEFTTGSGKSTQIHMHTLVGWSAAGTGLRAAKLGYLAGFRAYHTRWGQHRMWRKISLDVLEFDRGLPKWIFTGDAETGRRFLNDDVKRELQSSPRGEAWFIGGGWVCCLYENPLDEKNLLLFVERARRVFSLAE